MNDVQRKLVDQAERADLAWNRLERYDLLELLKTIRDDHGIKADFAPIGTLNYAGKLLDLINALEGNHP